VVKNAGSCRAIEIPANGRLNTKTSCSIWLSLVVVLGLSCWLPATNVLAQAEVGALHGTVMDTQGGVLVGATVELSGLGAPMLQVTDKLGGFHFVALDPGQYRVEASLQGFSTVEHPHVDVRIGQSSTIAMQLPAAVGEVITVVAESPLLDERNISTGVAMPRVELDTIPVTRNLWALVNQVPGVLSDRINVGGSEGGGPATFRGPGMGSSENTHLIDGVEVGDMADVGNTPSYFDLHQFAEIQFGVSGTDVTKSTGGVSINLVTKRGTNEFRGSARFYRTDDRFFGWQNSKAPFWEQPDSVLAPNQPSFVGNTVDQVDDSGLEAGGPVLRDRLWFWGAFGTQDYRLRTGGATFEDVQDKETFYDYGGFRLNWQVVSSNSFVGSWNYAEHQRFGEGAGVSRPRETAWNVRQVSEIYRFEDAHVFSSSLFLSVAYGAVDSGFSLVSEACIAAGDCAAAPESLLDANGVWRRSFWGGELQRPSEQIKADGYFFFNTGNSSHELRFGGRYREFDATEDFAWPGRNLYVIDLDLFGEPDTPANLEWVFAEAGQAGPPTSTSYTSFWAQDTISLGRWTINAGLRYDLQEGRNEATVSQGNDAFPDLLPDIEYAGVDAPFDWSTILPRLGVTYALGEERKTLLRASFSQFAQQLGASSVSHDNAAGLREGSFFFLDLNENLEYDENDLLVGPGFCDGCPEDNVAAVSPNKIDPGFAPEIVTEGLLEIQHSILPDLVIGASYTYRDRSDINWERPLVEELDGSIRAAVADDWQYDRTLSAPLPDGSTATVDVFALGDSTRYSGGDLLTTSDRSVTYNGLGLTVTKRLSNQWMLRGFFQYGVGEWNVPESFVVNENPNSQQFASDVDGALFGEQSGFGGLGNVVLESTWSWNLNGMYQFAPGRPYGFDVAANLHGRQGYPVPYYLTYNGEDNLGRQNLSLLGGELDQFRVDDIFTADLRLEKEFATLSDLGFTFSIDIFNIFNSAYVMQREARSGVAIQDWL
jgi:hypothetical protein